MFGFSEEDLLPGFRVGKGEEVPGFRLAPDRQPYLPIGLSCKGPPRCYYLARTLHLSKENRWRRASLLG